MLSTGLFLIESSSCFLVMKKLIFGVISRLRPSFSFAPNIEKHKTNNNKYGIDNAYYDKYIKNKYDSLKNISKNTRYEDSPEYKDLDIFLSIAKDLGVNLKIAIFPSHGKWSDYSGITQETRSVVYTKLKDIAKKYNIEVMDYSNKEYESYFMYDVMHLGWRGWIDFERDLYKFAKEN